MNNREIEIVDIENRKVHVFPSLTAYSKDVGVSTSRIKNYLKNQRSISMSQHQRILGMAYEINLRGKKN